MDQLFNIDLKKIPVSSDQEALERKKNFELFLENGLPNKKDENWKFSDLNYIISKNFKQISISDDFKFDKKIEFINDFDHNHITLINGAYKSCDIRFEEKEKVKIESFKSFDNFTNEKGNNLYNLNKALSSGGFSLEVQKDYKCKKPIIIYNYFTSDLDNKIINNSNQIKLSQNSELTLIEYNMSEKSKFFKNTFENINIEQGSLLKSITIQKNKSNGYFYKNISGTQDYNSSYQNFILSSGLKFNKLDIDINLEKENGNCFILSGLSLGKDEHQEIKTQINHLAPNCKSYQKIKNVLENDSHGVYQGKIFVKDIAQKTDAYQLSKAILLSESSEFDSKPELEIYADDVRCSHGSTSGNLDKDSIYYLMTRGLNQLESKQLLVNAFLNEIADTIKSNSIRNFIKTKMETQLLNGYKKH